MATTDTASIKHLEIAKFFCISLFGEYTERDQMHAELGTLQIDRIYEYYEAKMNNTRIDSKRGQDLENGDECKFRTLQQRINRFGVLENYFFVSAKDIEGKTGNLWIGGVNTITQTLDRFLIPYEVHSSGKNIWINLSRKGKGYGKFNVYLISSEPYNI